MFLERLVTEKGHVPFDVYTEEFRKADPDVSAKSEPSKKIQNVFESCLLEKSFKLDVLQFNSDQYRRSSL